MKPRHRNFLSYAPSGDVPVPDEDGRVPSDDARATTGIYFMRARRLVAVVQPKTSWLSPILAMASFLVAQLMLSSGCSVIGYNIGKQFANSKGQEMTIAAAVASGEPVDVQMVDGVRRGIISWTQGDTLLLVSGVRPGVETAFSSEAREDTLLATDVLGVATTGQGSRSGRVGFLVGAAVDVYLVYVEMKSLRRRSH